VLSEQFADTDSWTLTYTHVGTIWALAGTKFGAATFKIGATTGNTTFTSAQLAAGDIIVEDASGGIKKSPKTFKAGSITGTADGTGPYTTQRNTRTLVMAQRHLAYATIKPVTMLGVEEFDYGRVIGIAWNAFWDNVILNQEYGFIIEAKR